VRLANIALFVFALIFITTLSFSEDKENKNVSALGFDFGISKKDALEIINSQGKKVLEDVVDSKRIRTIIVEGALIELPMDLSSVGLETKLEFYDDELMISSLVFKSGDVLNQSAVEAEILKYLNGLYGEPSGKEEVLNMTTWSWYIPDVEVVLSNKPENNSARIDYIYKPLNQSRMEEELQRKQKGEKVDPAKKMFFDGTFSKPPE
jgi:hypothetical protein